MTGGDYSGTPLIRKLGFKTGLPVLLKNDPGFVVPFFQIHAPNLELIRADVVGISSIWAFFIEKTAFEQELPRLGQLLQPDGMLWISWPKRASGLQKDLNEDEIRRIALQNGLVDIKVCSVNEVWSALKLVIPLSLR